MMSFMKGDLLSRSRKLVKGLAKAEPVWLKAIEKAPPATFSRAEKKLKPICLPEDVYIKKFFEKHPESKHEDAIKLRKEVGKGATNVHNMKRTLSSRG